jgi:transposase
MHNAHAGCDVSKDYLDVCLRDSQDHLRTKRFDNTPAGHHELAAWLKKTVGSVRMVVEATGTYSLDLALVLHAAEHVELMVANPRATRKFAEAQMQRSKTDQVDAQVLCDFARRMEFRPWQPPESEILELRGIARRIQALTVARTRERNRLRHAEATTTTPAVVINDIEVNIRHLERRLEEMLRQALQVVQAHVYLQEAFEHLTSVRGIGDKSAVLLVPELMILPEEMTVRQWVAHAGLDPRKHQSGDSIEKRERISKVGNVRLRRALYMPALVAIQWEPNIGAFYEKLLAKGKKPIVAVVAVMRKLLHSIYGMLKHGQDFDGEKFYQMPASTT